MLLTPTNKCATFYSGRAEVRHTRARPEQHRLSRRPPPLCRHHVFEISARAKRALRPAVPVHQPPGKRPEAVQEFPVPTGEHCFNLYI